jgi:hypothetical protein
MTLTHHRERSLAIAPDAARVMVGLYGGALFSLVSAPAGTVTEGAAAELAEAIVRAGLGS